MKTQDYRSILRAVEQALEICNQSSGFMDEVHRKICEDLRHTRDRLVRLLSSSGNPELT